MGFEADHQGGRTIRLSGELDLTVTDVFLDVARDAGPGGDYVLDLRELTFIDSSGIRAIVALAQESHCGVVLLEPRENVRRILELTRIEGHVGIQISERRAGG